MELLELVEKKLNEKLAEDITVIDMRSVNPFSDYFVIVTAKNVRHAASLADDVIQEAAKEGYDLRTREGADGSTWILVDLNTVVVHIFTKEARDQYNLERLWGDQPITRYQPEEESR